MRLKRKFGLIFYIIPILFVLVLLILEIGVAKKEVISEGIAYNESSDISYKVLLKKNNYYETPYLDDKIAPIASYIDSFIVNYTYLNTFSSDVDYTVKYSVVAELSVYDSNNETKPVFLKKYNLIDNQEIHGKGIMAKIDLLDNKVYYDTYNEIVKQLKKEIVPNATLTIKFNTDFTGISDKLVDQIKSSKTSTLTIPISQKTINVDIKRNPNKKQEVVFGKKSLRKSSIILIIFTVVLFVILTIKYIAYVLKSAQKRSKYEQAVNKILREFDRAITEGKGKLRIDKGFNTFEVKDFMELLDVHDNFNVPILYYKINKCMCVFLVKSNDDIYYNVMRSDDYE